MSNKKLGNDFEQEFCKLLSDHGFWVHNMANRKNGQPADVIAVKNDIAYLLDCKVCSNDKFDLRRIEDNQHLAMERWQDCNNNFAMFALKLNNGDIRILEYKTIKYLISVGIKALNEQEILNNTYSVEALCKLK